MKPEQDAFGQGVYDFHQEGCAAFRTPGYFQLPRLFEYLMVSPEEMADIVAGTGWQIAKIVPREDGVDYTAVIEKIRP
ncbi:hypothetical protein [Candidatus Leptofilum sp.]|uniref:hypothetical protein n=1 Tax=Candidatus Leptofilum sp. TaxID=3241576 RepID=UPI003B59EB59